jgi:hypothetical protein
VCDRGAAQGISPKSSGPQEMIIPALGAAVASDFISDFRIRMWPALTFPARLYLAHLSPHPDPRPQVCRVRGRGDSEVSSDFEDAEDAPRQPLVPTGHRSPVRIFSNHTVLAGAPLRNRTVDLLLTMHAGFV